MIGDRLRRRADQFDAVRRLGASWALLRLRHEFDLRSGRVRRRTPMSSWPQLGAPASDDARPVLVDPIALGSWLGTHVDADGIDALRARCAALRNREITVFGVTRRIDDWHVDPITGIRYEPGLHWSLVGERPGSDLKCVWEPSRFGWALDLARLHLIDPQAGADDVFWTLFEDWCRHNPPNQGVNWSCGQESSVRLLAVALVVETMWATTGDARRAQYASFVRATARRVAAHIGYARSQRNNHLSSEAMGLALAAAILASDAESARWQALADRAFAEVGDRLIFDDGGSSQYSTNYHRVFVHALVVRELLAKRASTRSDTFAVLERASRYLAGLIVAPDGKAAFHGHDDGADLLRLSGLEHRNLAGTLDLCSALVDVPASGVEAAHEAPAWFGLEPGRDHVSPLRDRIESYADAGVHIATRAGLTVAVRCGDHRFRPAHADQLSVELWVDGCPVAIDRGTYAYTSEQGADDRFQRSDHHNTVVLDSGDHMVRVGRFLWSRWSTGELLGIEETHDQVTLEFAASIGHPVRRARRTIRIDQDSVTVEDNVDGGLDWRVCWHIAQQGLPMIRTEPGDEKVEGANRAISYRQLTDDVVALSRRPSSRGVTTRFERPTS